MYLFSVRNTNLIISLIYTISLVLSDVLIKGDVSADLYLIIMEVVYDRLKDYKDHKVGLQFSELADELRHPILKMRGRQETRWARVDLLGLTTFIRNAPTIFVSLQRSMMSNLNDNTALISSEKKLKELRDPMFWLRLIGFIQIFDIIVEASLESQHESYFATTSLKLVCNAFDEIKALGEDWSWNSEALNFAGIGSPSEYVVNVKNGVFKPIVGDRAKIRRARMLNKVQAYRRELHNVTEESDNEDTTMLTYLDIQVGEIPVEGFQIYIEMKVISELQEVCTELYDKFHEQVGASWANSAW